MQSAFYLLLTVLPLTGTPKHPVKSRKRKREKDCGPRAQSVGHASSEPSTAASLHAVASLSYIRNALFLGTN